MNYRSHASAVLLAQATNEAVRTGCLDPNGPNQMPPDARRRSSVLFDVPCLSGIPMRGWLGEWRYDEIRIVVAAWPTAEVDRWIGAMQSGSLAGEVVATALIERQGGDLGPGSPRLRLVNILEPTIFISRSRREELRQLPAPCDAADPLGLYPRHLH